LFRASIIHKNGVAIDEVSRCKVLRWFKPGDVILVTREHFKQLIDAIYHGMEQLYTHLLTLATRPLALERSTAK
jgi:hypothetical protein